MTMCVINIRPCVIKFFLCVKTVIPKIHDLINIIFYLLNVTFICTLKARKLNLVTFKERIIYLEKNFINTLASIEVIIID